MTFLPASLIIVLVQHTHLSLSTTVVVSVGVKQGHFAGESRTEEDITGGRLFGLYSYAAYRDMMRISR